MGQVLACGTATAGGWRRQPPIMATATHTVSAMAILGCRVPFFDLLSLGRT